MREKKIKISLLMGRKEKQKNMTSRVTFENEEDPNK